MAGQNNKEENQVAGVEMPPKEQEGEGLALKGKVPLAFEGLGDTACLSREAFRMKLVY
jgi:hypothetical protein